MENKYILVALISFFAVRIESTGISIGAVDEGQTQNQDSVQDVEYECNRKDNGTPCSCENGVSGSCQNEVCNCGNNTDTQDGDFESNV